jgi:hypothetical protein
MDEAKEARAKEISDLLNKIFLPLLLAAGLVGNVISIYVFARESMRKHTTFRYLLLISLVDICTLLTGCGDNLIKVYTDLNVRYLSDFFCKSHSFMVYFFTQTSSLLLACMSVDRAFVISVKRSKKAATASSVNRIFMGVVALVTLFNVHFLVFPHLITVEMGGPPPAQPPLNDSAASYNSINLSEVTSQMMPPSYNVTYCYAYSNTTYYIYLTHISPW